MKKEQKRGNLIYNIDANELKNVLLILVYPRNKQLIQIRL